VSSDELLVVPPGARTRRAVPFQGNVRVAVPAAVLAFGVAAFTWTMLWRLDRSLVVDGTQQVVARAIELALAAATAVVPAYGVRAVLRSRRASRRAASGARYDAQIALEESRDDLWVVVGLGLSAFVVGFLAYMLSANDGAIRDVLFDGTVIWKFRSRILEGFWLNIKVFMVAEVIVLVWALAVAVVRLLPGRAAAPIRTLAIVYIDVFRGVPAIVAIYLIMFGFPIAKVPFFSSLERDSQRFWLGVLALVLVYGAYVAEVYRAGLEGVHWSQTAAARSLGLSQWQTLRHVVAPQAIRKVMPPLLNDFVALQKDTALLSVAGLVEVLNVANLVKNQVFNLSSVTGAALCFLVVTIPFTRLVDYLLKRDRQRTHAQ
jgi:polar amino acid transport system permease protein